MEEREGQLGEEEDQEGEDMDHCRWERDEKRTEKWRTDSYLNPKTRKRKSETGEAFPFLFPSKGISISYINSRFFRFQKTWFLILMVMNIYLIEKSLVN